MRQSLSRTDLNNLVYKPKLLESTFAETDP